LDADRGLLSEPRDFLGLHYITRNALEHRLDASVSYSLHHLTDTPEPTEDDQGLTNDVTVGKTNAGSARAEITSGGPVDRGAAVGGGPVPHPGDAERVPGFPFAGHCELDRPGRHVE
jgi:hypothetical protein